VYRSEINAKNYVCGFDTSIMATGITVIILLINV
jgi:hypothetical protein